MTDKKDDLSKFEKVPQILIDGEKYHESATIDYSVQPNLTVTGEGDTLVKIKTYKLVKRVIVRERVVSEKLIREDRDKETVLIELRIQAERQLRA